MTKSEKNINKIPRSSACYQRFSAFTLIELLITTGIVAIIAVVGIINLSGYRARSDLNHAGQEIVTFLRDAQGRSQGQESGSRWGVHFENPTSGDDFYEMFTGISYSTTTVTSKVVLPSSVKFTYPAASSSIDIFFAPITGQTATTTAVTLAGASVGVGNYDIVVRSNGRTSSISDTGSVGYWHFDEGTGTSTVDASGYGDTGTLTNGPAWQSGSNCKAGNCLSFDGTDDFVNLGSPAILNLGAGNFSLCAWFKTTDTEADIISNGISVNGDYLLMSYLTKLRGHIWYSGNSNTIDSVKTVNDNYWHYGCQVVDDTKIYLYVDGAYDNSQTLAGTKTGVTATVRIGDRDGSANSNNFTGLIDEVRVYNRALSATEILNQYNTLK